MKLLNSKSASEMNCESEGEHSNYEQKPFGLIHHLLFCFYRQPRPLL